MIQYDTLSKWWITVVSVLLSSAGAWSMGSITVVIGVSSTLMALFIPPHSGNDWSSHHHHRSMIQPRPNSSFSSHWACSSWSQKSWKDPSHLSLYHLQYVLCVLGMELFATPSSACNETYSSIKSCLQHTLSHEQTNLYTSLYSFVMHSSPALAARIPLPIPLPILTLQIVFQMKASKQGDSSLQLQSGRCLGPVLYLLITGWSLERWISSADFQFPPCQHFASILLDKFLQWFMS